MKKFNQSYLAAACLAAITIIIGLVASPSARAEISERFISGVAAFSFLGSASNPEVETASVSYNVEPFHFLTPIAPNSGDPQKFDASLLNFLTVEVCQVSGTECPVVKTFNVQGTGPEQLRIERTSRDGRYYIANWDTTRSNFSNTTTYRIQVEMANLRLGSIDLTPADFPRLGRTWPIKFLVEADPEIRVRVLRFRGQSASQVVSALKSEFNLCGQEAAALLAGDLRPFPQAEISVAISGVCQDVVIPDTTKVADEVTRNALSAYDPITGRMVFSPRTPLLNSLNRGDVLVSEPSTVAPYGYLRKVAAINRVNGGFVLETTQAKLNEAIYHGTLNATGELLPNDGTQPPVTSPLAAPGMYDGSIPSPNIVIDEGDVFNFHRDIDVTINFDGSEDGVEGTGTVRVTGFVYFNAGYNVGIGIRECLEIPPGCPDRFEAWAGLEQKSRLRVTGNFDGEIHKEKIIHPIPMEPIVFFIGPVPVVLVPEINVKLGVDGEAHLDFVFEGEAKSKFKAGAKWLNPEYGGNGWNNISEYLPLDKRIHAADINAKLRVEGYAKVDAKIKLYGVAGPGIDGSVGILIDADTGRRPFWFMQGHVTTNVSFEVGIADIIELGRYSTPILNEYIHIAQSTNSPPRFSNVNTGVIQANIATPITLGPRSGFFGHFDVTDREDVNPPGLTAHSNVDGPIALTHAFQTGGLRTITITATDSDGATSSITLTVNVTNSQPIVTVTAADNTVPAMVQYFVSARAFDFESGVLGCDRVYFVPAPGRTITRTDSGGACSATIVFSQEGSQTVTVTAIDPQGGVGTGSITVNVTPVPSNLPPVVDASTFLVLAIPRAGTDRGTCSIFASHCPVGENSVLFNGEGAYDTPLNMTVQASDPEGQPVTFQWICKTGTRQELGTSIGNGFYSCTPPFPLSPLEQVEVFAIASDGVGTQKSPVRTLLWGARFN